MNIPALKWLVQIALTDPVTPNQVRKLANTIEKRVFASAGSTDAGRDLFVKNAKVNLNRAFRTSGVTSGMVHAWLSSPQYDRAANTSKSIARARQECCDAFAKIAQGTLPTNAWGVGKRRGPKIEFSKTLEARAVEAVLARITVDNNLPEDLFCDENITGEELLVRKVLAEEAQQVPLFTKAQARRLASEWVGISDDEIKNGRKDIGGCEQAEINVAVSAINRYGSLAVASRYVDVKELHEMGQGENVTN